MNFLKEFSLEDAFVGKCVPCLYCKSPHFFPFAFISDNKQS